MDSITIVQVIWLAVVVNGYLLRLLLRTARISLEPRKEAVGTHAQSCRNIADLVPPSVTCFTACTLNSSENYCRDALPSIHTSI